MKILQDDKIIELSAIKNTLTDGSVAYDIYMCDCTGCDGGCTGNCYGYGADPDDTWGER